MKHYRVLCFGPLSSRAHKTAKAALAEFRRDALRAGFGDSLLMAAWHANSARLVGFESYADAKSADISRYEGQVMPQTAYDAIEA